MQLRVFEAQSSRTLLRTSVQVGALSDGTASIEAPGLQAGTRHLARVAFSSHKTPPTDWESVAGEAQFVTAPAADDARAVRFAFGGDLAGQNVGRDAETGFSILPFVAAREPDFFIGLGDMIYADGVCESTGQFGNAQIPGEFGPSADLAVYRAHWRYARADAGLQALLAKTGYFAIWDDHEVLNDFSRSEDLRDSAPYTKGVHLMPIGEQAFREYNPIERSRDGRMFRAVRWGAHLELFFLDNRSFRDPNRRRDDGPLPKTQLGAVQLAWLERSLAASDATWRIVISSVPISIPTGSTEARDGWADSGSATGFERELALLFAGLCARGADNTIWLTTDVHFATGFEYTPFSSAPDFHVREFVCGPLSAGLFARQDVDPTFRPRRLYFHGPNEKPASYAKALEWFNFGTISVDEQGRLELELVNALGRTVARQHFER
jgi:alkaline phosphatase D